MAGSGAISSAGFSTSGGSGCAGGFRVLRLQFQIINQHSHFEIGHAHAQFFFEPGLDFGELLALVDPLRDFLLLLLVELHT